MQMAESVQSVPRTYAVIADAGLPIFFPSFSSTMRVMMKTAGKYRQTHPSEQNSRTAP